MSGKQIIKLILTLVIAFVFISANSQNISKVRAFEIIYKSNEVDTTMKELLIYPDIVKSNYMSVKKDQIWALAPKFDAYSLIAKDKHSPQLVTTIFYVNIKTGDFVSKRTSTPVNCIEKLLSFEQCKNELKKQNE
ncbi:MAG: hypothetical protein MI866_07130 [Bacteroidales bacterium]|nr:hypothetical protein [Bacteroidales bacterium]